MTRRKLPWYKRNPRDYLNATRELTPEERGIYNDIIELLYLRDRPIPDDPRFIAGFVGVSVRKWSIVRQSLLDADKIIIRGDFISNARFEAERGERSEWQESQATWGHLGGKRRAQKAKAQRQGELELSDAKNASSPAKSTTYAKANDPEDDYSGDNLDQFQQNQSLSHPEPLEELDDSFLGENEIIAPINATKNSRKIGETEQKSNDFNAPLQARARASRVQKIDTNVRDSSEDVVGDMQKGERKPRLKTATARQLPNGWTPPPMSDTIREFASHWPQGMMERETEKFIDHAAANGRTAKDWDAAFRNWLRKADDDWKRANRNRPSGKGWASVGHRLTG
jgi:uncharacterized protein YdaU (DUF1376 family)